MFGDAAGVSVNRCYKSTGDAVGGLLGGDIPPCLPLSPGSAKREGRQDAGAGGQQRQSRLALLMPTLREQGFRFTRILGVVRHRRAGENARRILKRLNTGGPRQ